jgi:excisionase family DNA binding protein
MTLDVMHAQTATPDANVLMSVAEVARRAGVSRRTVYREIDRGALVARYVGHQLRIDPDDFREYLDGERP